MNPVLLAFLQFALLALGTGAFFTMIVIFLLAMIEGGGAAGAKNWASTEGLIVASYVSARKDNEDPKGLKTYYVPSVSYTYFVNGKQEMGSRLYFGASKHPTASDAVKRLEKFPAGAMVPVYFDPDKPDKPALERLAPHASFLQKVALVVLTLCVVAFALAFLLPEWVG